MPKERFKSFLYFIAASPIYPFTNALPLNPIYPLYVLTRPIMSLEKIKNRYNLMKEEYKKDNIIDFAFMYIGMGHIIVAAIDTKDKQVFLRRDGGSNGYDREFNLKFIIDYEPKIEDKISFSNWLLSINKQELPKTIN